MSIASSGKGASASCTRACRLARRAARRHQVHEADHRQGGAAKAHDQRTTDAFLREARVLFALTHPVDRSPLRRRCAPHAVRHRAAYLVLEAARRRRPRPGASPARVDVVAGLQRARELMALLDPRARRRRVRARARRHAPGHQARERDARARRARNDGEGRRLRHRAHGPSAGPARADDPAYDARPVHAALRVARAVGPPPRPGEPRERHLLARPPPRRDLHPPAGDHRDEPRRRPACRHGHEPALAGHAAEARPAARPRRHRGAGDARRPGRALCVGARDAACAARACSSPRR